MSQHNRNTPQKKHVKAFAFLSRTTNLLSKQVFRCHRWRSESLTERMEYGRRLHAAAARRAQAAGVLVDVDTGRASGRADDRLSHPATGARAARTAGTRREQKLLTTVSHPWA